MNEEQRVAFVLSQVACFYGKLEAMKVANKRADELDHVVQPYFESDFEDLASQYGLEHNQVLTTLHGG